MAKSSYVWFDDDNNTIKYKYYLLVIKTKTANMQPHVLEKNGNQDSRLYLRHTLDRTYSTSIC